MYARGITPSALTVTPRCAYISKWKPFCTATLLQLQLQIYSPGPDRPTTVDEEHNVQLLWESILGFLWAFFLAISAKEVLFALAKVIPILFSAIPTVLTRLSAAGANLT